jgi:TP901 family phage tail tape measure protein
MADEQIVTNIVATSDFSNLITDLNKVSSALTKLQDKLQATNKTLAAQVAVMNRSFADTIRSTGQFSTHFVSLTSDVDKFGQQLDRGQMKLGQFFRVYAQHAKSNGGLIRDLAKQQVQLQNSVLQPLGKNAEGLMQYNVHIPRGIDVVKNKTAIARQELQIMNKVVQEGAGQLINWGKNTQWAGRQLTVGLTVPMAAFGKASADAFRTADEQLVRLTKVYGGISQTSASELLKVRKDVIETARQISKSMGASFNETIGLAADIAATGKTGNELLKSVQETTRLAVLGEVDRQEAMKATLAIQTAFKSNTEELANSINFLNAVENQTSTTLNDLVEAIPKAGPIVKGLGGDVKDLALYLTAMREGGINASEGANALKSGLASLINPTKVATGMFAGFGIDLKNIVLKNAGDTTATILELQAALETLNPLQKQQALEQLFGKFQFARMNALFENLGKQGSQTLQVLDLMKASTQELGNLADRELSQVTESASGRYRRALEGLKADLAAIGDQFLDINTKLINFIDGILKFVQRLPDPIKKILGFLGMFTAAAGPLIMLTGVLGNFFGYIIKGVSHMRALFKGGEGWKLLTPEILAAQKAGALVEQTFYSDAKAAAILKQAIAGLSGEFDVLREKAKSASAATSVAVNPGVSTVAGNVILSGGPRVVDSRHPLVGKVDTRAAAHHNPRGMMTQAQRDAQTIHSVTPGSIDVNQKIGTTPQMFMTGDLPKIEGLTAVKGVSTGIVAGEAAKWHALMGSLAMLTKKEVATLKKEIARTGTFSTDISQSFGQLLPVMTDITNNAARRSAQIVAQLQSGKITLDAARSKIIALNAEIEAMMAQATTQVATGLGRTASLTQTPLTGQPIVSPTGKSNIKEIFRAGRKGKAVIDTIARTLGIRTYGAGYSIETTIPKKMATGGIVPGVGNTDTYPTTLPEGAFVVNKQATAQNMDIIAPMLGMNMGGQVPVMLTPGEAVIDPQTASANLGTLYAINGPGVGGNKLNLGGVIKSLLSRKPTLSAGSISGNPQSMFSLFGIKRKGKFSESGSFVGPRGGEIVSVSAKPATATYGAALAKMPINPDTGKPHTLASLNGAMARRGLKGDEIKAYLATLGYMSQGGPLVGTTTQLLNKIVKDPKLKNKILQEIDDKFYKKVLEIKKSGQALTDSNNPYHDVSNEVLNAYFEPGSLERSYWDQFKVQTSGLNPLYLSDIKRGAGHSSSAGAQTVYVTAPDGTRIKIGKVKGSGKGTMAFHSSNKDWESEYGFNNGGMVQGYNAGGIIGNVLKGTAFKNLGARFGKVGNSWGATSLSIGMGKKLFGSSGLTPKAQNLMYGKLIENLEKERPYGYVTNAQGQLQRALEPDIVDTLLKSSASDVLSSGGKSLSKIDREILRTKYANWDSKSWTPSTSKIRKQMFGANKGGIIPGYNRGGMVMPKSIPVPSQNGKYNMGGKVQGYNAGGMIASTLLGLLGSQGGAALGSKYGGETGSMIGSMLGFAVPGMLMAGRGPRMAKGSEEAQGFYGNKLDKSIIGNTKFGASLANTAAQGSKVSRVLMGMAGLLTKTNLILAGVTTAVVVGYKAWQNHKESLRLNALSYGLTAEAAQKAGLKFVDYNAKIKDSINNVKMVTERNKLMYESMKSAGLPIQMTIEQYKKLRKEVKSTMSDYVKMIDRAKDGDLASMAERLKTQFIAAGMSADEAAKKIYIAFTLSNKAASAAVSTVGNANFNKIIDAQTAAVQAMESFNKAASFENAKTQATALNTALQAVDGSLENIVAESEKKAKADKTGKTEVITRYEAEKQMLNGITSNIKGQKTLTQGLIDELAKQNPLIRDFATTQDTVLSLWQKMRLAAQGYTGDLTMGAQQTKALYTVYNKVASAVEAKNKEGALKSQYANLNSLQAQLEKAQNAAKGQSVQQQIDSKKAIDAIDDRIKKIKEEADARRKALSQQQQDEDSLTQIKKKQLEYQQALASGDMAAAAQAQLDIQSLNRQQQVTQATRAIDNKEASDIAKLEKQRDALSKKDENLANKAAKAAESMGSLTEKISKQKEAIDTFNSAVTNLQVAIIEKKKDISGESAAVVKAGEAAGVKTSGSDKVGVYDGSRLTYREKTPQERAKDFMPKDLSKTLNTDTVYVNAKNLIDNAGTFNKPKDFGRVPGLDPRDIYKTAWGRIGPNSAQQQVEEYARAQGVKPGQQFTLGSGNKKDNTYKDYQFRVREDGTVVLVKKFAAGGMVTNRPLAMPKFNRMGMGGPVVNSVPRYNSGGYVSSSKSSSSSVVINTLNIEFPNTPPNAKEMYAQIKEIAKLEGTKVSQGKSA